MGTIIAHLLNRPRDSDGGGSRDNRGGGDGEDARDRRREMNKDIPRDMLKAFVGVGMSLVIIGLISKSWLGTGGWEKVRLVFVGMALLIVTWDFIVTKFLEK